MGGTMVTNCSSVEYNKNLILRDYLNRIYTPVEEAREEVWRRWNNLDLRRGVEGVLLGDMPTIFKDAPRAAISRHIISPNFELLHFLDAIQGLGLSPVGLEYLGDKFVSKNEDKYFLGKLFFYGDVGKKGGRNISVTKVIDFSDSDGRKFCDIETPWEINLVDFHHKLAEDFLSSENLIDMTVFFQRHGGVAARYYQYLLSFFLCHGILFENFLLCGNYMNLTRDILLPSFFEVEKKFGIKPLIVPLVPIEQEEDVYWRYYPKSMQSVVCDIIKEV